MAGDVIVVRLPALAGHALREYSRRVQLDEAELLLDALREASWFRDSVRAAFPPGVVAGTAEPRS